MTTEKAMRAGKSVESQTTKSKKKEEAKNQPFKGVSAFHVFFGATWCLLNRIAFDCAHEFGNLGMDLLALINNKDKMHFNEARQSAHKKIKRGKLTGYTLYLYMLV